MCRKTLSGEDTSQTEYVGPASNNPNQNPEQSTATTASAASNAQQSNPSQSNNNNIYDEMDFD